MQESHTCRTEWGWCTIEIDLHAEADLEEVMLQVRATLLGLGYTEDDLEGYIHI